MLEEKPTAQPKPYDWSHFIIQKAPAGVITMDGQGRITDCNPAAEEITGENREQILGRLAQDVLHCKMGEHEDCPIRLAMRGQNLESKELVLLNSSGQEVPVMHRGLQTLICGGESCFASHSRANTGFVPTKKIYLRQGGQS
jgi:PAS domain S-box-containing protein